MAPTTTDLQPIERDVLDHFKEGVGTHTIAMRVNRDRTEVQDIIQTTAGGDRAKAAALVADYDRRHGITPTEKPVPWTPPVDTPALPAPSLDPPTPAAVAIGRKKTPARRAAAQAVIDVAGIPAPTVVPVTITFDAPTDTPATSHYDPATGRAPDLPLEPPTGDQAAPLVSGDELTWEPDDATDQGDDGHQDAGTGDAWAAPERATDQAITGNAAAAAALDQCTHGADCRVHPKTQGLHNFDNAEADRVAALLAGPREQLPAVKSFESLIAAVQQSGDRPLRELAAQIAALVDQLHDGYARERQIRLVRAEADQLRRDLDARITMLARLAAGETPTT